MYDVDTEIDEQFTDTDDDEQDSEEQKAKDREIIRKAEIDKVPNWVKDEIRKGQVPKEDFETMYSAKRDKERYDDSLSTFVKKNQLNSDEEKQIQTEVTKLAKLKDDEGNTLGYETALSYVTKGMTEKSTKRDLQIALGALPEKGEAPKKGLRIMKVVDYDNLSQIAKREYSKQSKELHGEVKFL